LFLIAGNYAETLSYSAVFAAERMFQNQTGPIREGSFVAPREGLLNFPRKPPSPTISFSNGVFRRQTLAENPKI
jgi:hypothetical protein